MANTDNNTKEKKPNPLLRGALLMIFGTALIVLYVLGLLSPEWRFVTIAVPVSIIVLGLLAFTVLVGFETTRMK